MPVPNSLIFQAAEYKTEYSISSADCFVLASALDSSDGLKDPVGVFGMLVGKNSKDCGPRIFGPLPGRSVVQGLHIHRIASLPRQKDEITMLGFSGIRRRRLRNESFPPEWAALLQGKVPFYRFLPEKDRKELHGHTHVLLAEKHFEGCDGLILTDEIKTTIAAQASILLLHRKPRYYPHLHSIVVYPHAYIARRARVDAAKVVHEGPEVRSGEAWSLGTIVLSWENIKAVASRANDCRNVVLHEFAHQLDMENRGVADGAPLLPRRSMYAAWAHVLGNEYEHLLDDVEHHRRTTINPYGATHPAEFFAVVTECFFENPIQLNTHHPQLYEQFQLFYRQDPAALLERVKAER